VDATLRGASMVVDHHLARVLVDGVHEFFGCWPILGRERS
jgi:hypothetical protein